MKTYNPYNFCLFKIPAESGRLIWEITNKCNYSCKYCIFSSGAKNNDIELETEEILSALDGIRSFGIRQLKITWWEPFTRKDIWEILAYATKIGFEIDISTNASLLTEKHIQILNNPNIKYVHVSLDGSNSQMQALVRWERTFDLTIMGIKKLVKAWIYTRIWSVIHKWNEDYLKNIIEKVTELWANEIIFSLMEPVWRMKWDDELVSTKSIIFLEKKLDLLKLKYKDKILINYSFTEKDKKTCTKKSCPWWEKFIFLNHKWQLSPCTWVSEYFPEFISKNTLKTNSFSELMNGPEMLRYKEFQNNLISNWMSWCPKSYLKEISIQKELSELFENNFNDNIKKVQRFSKYSQIYSFTTENLSWYFPKLDFSNAKVLTVTGSWDHAINSFLFWAKNVICFDSNVLSRLWAEFKIVAMKNLDYEEFLDFFLRESKTPLSYDLFQKFREQLSSITRIFFDKIYSEFSFDSKKIRESALFNNQYDIGENKINYNPYLLNESTYLKAKNNTHLKNITFFDLSIEELCCDENYLSNNKFDIILLSNIADYSHEMYKNSNYLNDFKNNIILPLQESLSTKWKLLLAYIYNTENIELRNNIDSPIIRKKVFSNDRYSEIIFPSAINKIKTDTICIQEKQIQNSLIENSISYYEKANFYDIFSEAEDSDWKVLDFLKKETKNKIVLDVWCWTGKYLKLLAPTIKKGLWVDVSDKQIDIAREKCKLENNLQFIISTAEKIDIPDNSVDIIYWTWCIGSIPDADRREIIVKELRRILKKWWKMYLIENEETWEFEEIRWKTVDLKKPTRNLNKHICRMWFKKYKKVNSSFKFKNLNEAKIVFWTIWWEKVANKIKSRQIDHNIIIFSGSK